MCGWLGYEREIDESTSAPVDLLLPIQLSPRPPPHPFPPTFPSVCHALAQYNVNHRIAVACRDKNVYTMKKMEVQGNVVSMGVAAVGLEVVDLKVSHRCAAGSLLLLVAQKSDGRDDVDGVVLRVFVGGKGGL